MATSQLVNTDSLGYFTDVQPEKFRVRGNPRKGIISVRAGFYASRDAEFCVPEITVCAYMSALFHLFSALWADIVHKILAMQTIGQVVGKRLTTLIQYEVLITK